MPAVLLRAGLDEMRNDGVVSEDDGACASDEAAQEGTRLVQFIQVGGAGRVLLRIEFEYRYCIKIGSMLRSMLFF